MSGTTGLTTGGSASCGPDAGNGFTNLGGDEASPLPAAISNQKHGTPTLGSLFISGAADIGLMFDGTDPGSSLGVEILDITMKFYDATTWILLGAIDGNHDLSATNPGVGNAGFGFRIDAVQAAIVQGWINTAGGPSNTRFALESTLAAASGGPDSWLVFSLGTPPPPALIPEPASLVTLSAGLAAIGLLLRRAAARNKTRCP